MKLRARNVNNFDLYANHAWYLPGVKGMFALFGFFLLGSILGGIVIGILGLFVPQAVLVKYEMVVTYPLSFLPVMIYAANKSQRNSLFETGYKLNSTHFGPFKWWQLALITVVLTFSYMFAFDYVNYLNFKVTTTTPLMKQFYDFMVKALEQMMEGPFWSSFLVTAIFAPIFEEWMCRGMVLRGLLTKMKPVWAVGAVLRDHPPEPLAGAQCFRYRPVHGLYLLQDRFPAADHAHPLREQRLFCDHGAVLFR